MWDSAPPSAALAAALEGAAGEGWRCEGGSRAEIVGAVRAAAALESWWCAAKLGLIRAAIRQDDDGLGGAYHGDLPDEWSRSLTTDIALALAMSPVSAEKLMQTAWDLGALLPGIGALLEDGTLTYPKARAVNDALELLSEEDKTAAEAMIVPLVAGKTFGQVDKIAAQAAITVDPDLAERTREHAERNRARVILRRERSGAASLSGCDLPPAESLAAHAATCARAELYKGSGAFPGVFMDQLRAMAYLDLINEISAEARIAAGPPDVGLGAPGESAFRDEPEPDDPGAPAPDGSGGSDCPCAECDGRCAPPDDDDDDDADPGDDEPGDEGPSGAPNDDQPDAGGPDDDRHDGRGSSGGGGQPASPTSPPPSKKPQPSPPPASPPSPTSSSPWSAPPSSPAPPKPIDLTIPLATLLGPRRRPGESHGFGPLDPALSRALAALAAASPHTTACVTVTDHHGHAIGHGCLTTGRRKARLPGAPDPPLTALPAHLNLTITATRLTDLLQPAGRARPPGPARRTGPASPTGWALAPRPTPASTPRPTTRPGAGPGPSPCPAACSTPSRSSPSPPTPATTAASRTPTSPTTPSATWSRSATTSAPCRPAPAPLARVRLRARRPLRPGRKDVRLQRRSTQPRLPPGQAVTRLESHPAQTRLAPMANPQRPDLHPRTQAIPHLTRRRPAAEAAAPRPGPRARTPAGGVPRSAHARECPGPQPR